MEKKSDKLQNTNPKKFSMQKLSLKDRKVHKRKVALSRIKRRILKHIWLVRLSIIASFLLGFYFIVLFSISIFKNTGASYYAGLLSDFVKTPDEKIESFEGRTNILILGKGGGAHDAPDLTDTIIFASIAHPTSPKLFGVNDDVSIALISLPRDIWVPELRAKLNSVYYWGNQKEKGGGVILAKSIVEDIVGMPIHYATVVDFDGFVKVIDVLGGVEVDVKTSFVDEQFPIPGKENDECLPAQASDGDREYECRYETLQFVQGKQLMDGETALKFSRSRNAEGDEGTDFARAARQQLVLDAIKEKATSEEIIKSPKKALAIWEVIKPLTETDIDPSAGAILFRRGYETKDNLNSHVLPEELLEQPRPSARYDNLYVFIPVAEDLDVPHGRTWSGVHEWIRSVLD